MEYLGKKIACKWESKESLAATIEESLRAHCGLKGYAMKEARHTKGYDCHSKRQVAIFEAWGTPNLQLTSNECSIVI
jgi:hypothetical protein